MLEIATRPRLPTWIPAALASLALTLPAGVARADQVDACISAAERSQVQRRDAHLRAARDALVSCARDACPRAIQRDCKRWLGEVEAAMPSVVIRATDRSDHDLVAVRVLVDGVPLTETLDGRALAIDPGEHLLRLEAGGNAVTQHVVIREGERGRMLSLKLSGEAPRGSEAPARPVPVGAWVLGGIGVAAIGTGVALWIQGRSERSDLYATCGVMHDCTPGAVDRARSKLVGGDVAAGLGLGAIGGALWWALAARSSPPPPVDVRPVSGGGVLSWLGTF